MTGGGCSRLETGLDQDAGPDSGQGYVCVSRESGGRAYSLKIPVQDLV